MLVERFEDLTCWQKARALTKEVYLATRREAFARDFGLAGQIQRAAVSTMSNIAEGFERGSRGEFQQFLNFSKSSCGEVRSELYVALDVGYLSVEEFERLRDSAIEVSKITTSLWHSVGEQRRNRR